ncbi:unnamed protein product [Sphagnum tenellum]
MSDAGKKADLDAIARLQNMFAPEPLHPDLVPYLRDTDHIGQMIHHKLVISIMHSDAMNKMVNRRYEQTKAMVDEAYASADWQRYVFLHERPYRFDALMEIMEPSGFWVIDNPERANAFWRLVSSVWIDSENIHENYNDWHEIWSSDPKPVAEAVMDEDDRATFAALPEMVKVWRGATHKNVANGLSWTIDKNKAEWFARRFSNPDRPSYIASGRVTRNNILAYFGGRNEKEVIIIPEHVMNVKVRRVK